jgi:hypothetical protein
MMLGRWSWRATRKANTTKILPLDELQALKKASLPGTLKGNKSIMTLFAVKNTKK